jgi:hypothetical protein
MAGSSLTASTRNRAFLFAIPVDKAWPVGFDKRPDLRVGQGIARQMPAQHRGKTIVLEKGDGDGTAHPGRCYRFKTTEDQGSACDHGAPTFAR